MLYYKLFFCSSRPESAYSSGNESSSSAGLPHHTYNGSNAAHANHISSSNGPGSASSTASSSSTSAETASDAVHYEKLLAWARNLRQCANYSERLRLTELYTLDWQRYRNLRNYIVSVKDKFDDLKAELDMARGRRAEYQRLTERIRCEYDIEMRLNSYKQKREQYVRLRAHLSRVSALVQLYDEERELQLKNQMKLMGTTTTITGCDNVEMLSSGNIAGGMQQRSQAAVVGPRR